MQFKKINLITFGILLAFTFLLTNVALANTFEAVNSGFGKTGSAAGYPGGGGAPTKTFSQAWGTYVTEFILGVGAAFFMVLIIYGGWLWMTARGNEEQVGRAKKLILGAVIGFAILLAARIITELIFDYLGKSLTTTETPG